MLDELRGFIDSFKSTSNLSVRFNPSPVGVVSLGSSLFDTRHGIIVIAVCLIKRCVVVDETLRVLLDRIFQTLDSRAGLFNLSSELFGVRIAASLVRHVSAISRSLYLVQLINDFIHDIHDWSCIVTSSSVKLDYIQDSRTKGTLAHLSKRHRSISVSSSSAEKCSRKSEDN